MIRYIRGINQLQIPAYRLTFESIRYLELVLNKGNNKITELRTIL
jgi:hypothetical protein